MEFSWPIFVLVVAVNTLYISAMLLAQALDKKLPLRNSFIPGTKQRFLYVQDFWTMTWGDGIGVPLIANAFVHLAVKDTANLWLGLPIAVVSSLGFLRMCLGKGHKPDYGFPDIGKVSFAGILHLFYFGAGVAAGAMCTRNLIAGHLQGPVMWVALGGGVLYVGCFFLELKSGNFNLLSPATRFLEDDEILPPPKPPVQQVLGVIGWLCAWIFYPGNMAAVSAYNRQKTNRKE